MQVAVICGASTAGRSTIYDGIATASTWATQLTQEELSLYVAAPQD